MPRYFLVKYNLNSSFELKLSYEDVESVILEQKVFLEPEYAHPKPFKSSDCCCCISLPCMLLSSKLWFNSCVLTRIICSRYLFWILSLGKSDHFVQHTNPENLDYVGLSGVFSLLKFNSLLLSYVYTLNVFGINSCLKDHLSLSWHPFIWYYLYIWLYLSSWQNPSIWWYLSLWWHQFL